MIISLVRYKDTGKTTFGKLFIDGQFQCVTLEDEYRENKVHAETRVPCGTYAVDMRYSPKFSPLYGHNMLWIKDVPGFDFILIHKGNTEADTAGCVLVGSGVYKDGITNSKIAYDILYPKVVKEINSGKKVYITIIDFDRS